MTRIMILDIEFDGDATDSVSDLIESIVLRDRATIARPAAQPKACQPDPPADVKPADPSRTHRIAASLVGVAPSAITKARRAEPAKGRLVRGNARRVRNAETGEEFDTVALAADSIGASGPGLTAAINAGRPCKGTRFVWAGKDQKDQIDAAQRTYADRVRKELGEADNED